MIPVIPSRQFGSPFGQPQCAWVRRHSADLHCTGFRQIRLRLYEWAEISGSRPHLCALEPGLADLHVALHARDDVLIGLPHEHVGVVEVSCNDGAWRVVVLILRGPAHGRSCIPTAAPGSVPPKTQVRKAEPCVRGCLESWTAKGHSH